MSEQVAVEQFAISDWVKNLAAIQEQRPGRKKGETDLFNYRPEDYPHRALNRVVTR